jgi:hypothetical protein
VRKVFRASPPKKSETRRARRFVRKFSPRTDACPTDNRLPPIMCALEYFPSVGLLVAAAAAAVISA